MGLAGGVGRQVDDIVHVACVSEFNYILFAVVCIDGINLFVSQNEPNIRKTLKYEKSA